MSIVFRKSANGGVGEGWVTKVEANDKYAKPDEVGKYLITYMTFDGYVDDGYWDDENMACLALEQAIKGAKKTAEEFGKRANNSPTGMY